MSRGQRIRTFLIGLITIIGAIFLIRYRSFAYELILFVLAIGFMCTGINLLLYYIFMAKNMVDGKVIFYKGIILFNFGVMSSSITNVPKIYILLYLAVIHAFSGLIEMLRAKEAKSYGAKSWRLKMIHGLVNIMMAAFCIIFVKHQNTAIYIYCIGLIYSGLMRIGSAFRRTTFMFIR